MNKRIQTREFHHDNYSNDSIGWGFIISGVIAALIIVSYDPSDASYFQQGSTDDINNLLGKFGATLAAFIIRFNGLIVLTFPFVLIVAGAQTVRKKIQIKWVLEFVGVLISLVCVMVIAGFFESLEFNGYAHEPGGIWGRFLWGFISGKIGNDSSLLVMLILPSSMIGYYQTKYRKKKRQKEIEQSRLYEAEKQKVEKAEWDREWKKLEETTKQRKEAEKQGVDEIERKRWYEGEKPRIEEIRGKKRDVIEYRVFSESANQERKKQFQTIFDKISALKSIKAQVFIQDEFGFMVKDAESKWNDKINYFIERAFPSGDRITSSQFWFLKVLIDFVIENCKTPLLEVPENGHEFEQWVSQQFSNQNIDSHVTKGSGDQGIDVIVNVAGTKWGIQCKRYSIPVGNTPVQEVVAGLAYHNCSHGAVIATSGYTTSARDLARSNNVVLCTQHDFLKKICGLMEADRNNIQTSDQYYEIHKKSIEQLYLNSFNDFTEGWLDPLYYKAVREALNSRQANITYLESVLDIGDAYARVAKMIDAMEEEGLVGPHRGSKAREILVPPGYIHPMDEVE